MSKRKQRTFSREFKERAVLRMETGEPTSALAVELGMRRKLIYDWRDAYRRFGLAGLNRKTRAQAEGLRRGGGISQA